MKNTPGDSLEFQIGDLLRAQHLTLATAESCTGGLVADRITDISGSSDYFTGGVVAYANSVKIHTLGVLAATIERHGAVSRETALEMARGARRLLNADLAVSVTGIAGPGGGLPGKPVGTTWLGLAAHDGEWARLFTWDGDADREQNKAFSARAALQMVSDYLQGSRTLDSGRP
jgi:PncC family amidohydrolase